MIKTFKLSLLTTHPALWLSAALLSGSSFLANAAIASPLYSSITISNAIQDNILKGQILDPSGVPVVGATVLDKSSKKSTLTTSTGEFTLRVKHFPTTIAISCIGHKTKQIKLTENRALNITLEVNTTALSEVVVVGFGSQKKANLTGAVSAVKMKDAIGDRPITNVSSALQGAVPGLFVGSNGNSPGASKNFQIRGAYSIGDGSGKVIRPLVLIDNVEGDISLLNPDDIESVSVLKDAASAAIYGARAAGGVVLITTKHPKAGAQFELNYNNNFTFTRAINLPKQASLMDFLDAREEVTGDGYWSLGAPSISRWRELLTQYKQDPSSLPIYGDGMVKENGAVYYLHEKDLVKHMLETGFQQKHNISASGSAEGIRYRLSGGWVDNDGILITNKDHFRRLNISSFLSAEITPWFTQQATLSYATSKRKMPNSTQGMYSTRLCSYYPEGTMPKEIEDISAGLPFFTPENQIRWANTSESKYDNPRIFLKSIINPINHLSLVFEYTFDGKFKDYYYYTGSHPYTTIQGGKQLSPQEGKDCLTKQKTDTRYNAINLYGTYDFQLERHHVRAMAGFNQERKRYGGMTAQSFGQASKYVPALGAGMTEIKANDYYSNFSIRGSFFRLNYDYDNRYLVEVNGRYDGSSKFPHKGRFGFFPSVSAGWNMANEKFMDFSKEWLGALKWRVSYGKIGNQNISPYTFIPTMDISNTYNGWLSEQDYVTAIVNMPQLVRSNFTWEKVHTLDVGLDWSLFSNRLTGSFDWYRKDTKGMLAPGMQLPGVVGADAPMQNTADMRTKGWDFSMQWRDRKGDFRYDIGFNISDYTSKITKYKSNEAHLLKSFYEGQKLGDIWGYVFDRFYTVDDFQDTQSWILKEGIAKPDGVNPRPGDILWKNIRDDEYGTNVITNGDGTDSNPGDRKVIGNTLPRYICGLNLGASYKGFAISLLMQGTLKRDAWIANTLTFPLYADWQFTPLYKGTTNYWRAKDRSNGDYTCANQNAKYPRIYGEYGNMASNYRVSDKYLSNAAYWRIQNITLSYSFPKSITSRLYLSNLKAFVNVENLATFSNLPDGIDPETLSWNYPANRAFSFGLNLTL